MLRRKFLLVAAAAPLVAAGIACSDDDPDSDAGADGDGSQATGEITLYSGRAETLVSPLIAQFERDTSVKVKSRYAGSAELAATIQEEGKNSPADIFWSQDPGPLGALSAKFDALPPSILETVDTAFKSAEGKWVGLSGRIRVAAYNPDRVQPAQIPNALAGFTAPAWKDRVGWSPTNGSFQIMVTALRSIKGEDVARKWLEDMKANGAKSFGNNNAVLTAVAAGEVDVGLINHYYLHAARRTTPTIKAENHYLNNPDDPGSLIMVSGAGILSTAKNKPAAQRFIDYMLSASSQQYFASETSEYPVVDGIISPPGLKPFDELVGPRVDFADLADLQGTLALLRQAGVVS